MAKLISIYRTFHPNTAEYTFFLNSKWTITKINHKLNFKSNLGKFKIMVTVSIFSFFSLKQNAMIYTVLFGGSLNPSRLTNTSLHDQEVTDKIRERGKKKKEKKNFRSK